MDRVVKLASQKAVVIFSTSSCCMSHAIKILFQDHGVSPTVHELDKDSRGDEMEKALMRLGCNHRACCVHWRQICRLYECCHDSASQWLTEGDA